MKKINILKEFSEWNIKLHDKYIFINLFSKSKKDNLTNLIYKIHRYFKEKKINKWIKNKIYEILDKYNIIYFNSRWIYNNIDISNDVKIIDLYIPILIPDNDKEQLIELLKRTKRKRWNNQLDSNDNDFLKKINYVINDIFLKWSRRILPLLYKELLNEYDIIKDIETNKSKTEWSLFIIKEKYREYFAYIYNKKVYVFNMFLLQNKIIIKKDKIYYWIYNKQINIFLNEYYKIKKINKLLLEQMLSSYYNITPIYLNNNYVYKSIFKKDIIKYIKESY